jgi:hypothetical protein
MIHRITQLVDERGYRIDVLSEYTDVLNTPVKFVGHAAGIFNTPHGKQRGPYDFEIKADSAESAFEKFEEASRARGQAIQDDIDSKVLKARLAGKT